MRASLIVLLLSLSVHESAHAFTADLLGDPTARMLGRVSLNPAVHVDLIGTILFPLIALLTNLPIIGWAKPVPVNFGALRHPKRDMLWVAAAGPLANLLMALGWAVLLKLSIDLPSNEYSLPMQFMGEAGISVNVVLMVLNLLPIPVLDGGHIFIMTIETISRRDFSLAMKEKMLFVGFVLLMTLMATVIYNDLTRIAWIENLMPWR